MTANSSFFSEQKEQSEIKTAIVSKYFWVWAKIIMPWAKDRKIAYIDLFAGPGRYADGSKSTPLLVLERAIADPIMREMLVTLFNDADGNHSHSLETAIQSLPGIESLKHKPKVKNQEVGTEIVAQFEERSLIPTLFFVDPWGYKGLSLRLINSVLKNWGCDCIFFFNYNRIKMGLPNAGVDEHMNALFGKERADKLRIKLKTLQPGDDKELVIVEELSEALRDLGGKFVLPFRFRHQTKGLTSHHLIFVSKHVRGYEIMKEIMAGESSDTQQGVPTFEYNPATKSQPLLFELARPLDALGPALLEKYRGRSLAVLDVYNEHHVGTRYIKKNYKQVLIKLSDEGKIVTNRSDRNRRGHEMPDKVLIQFPA